MKIFKTMIPTDRGLILCDTIKHDDHIWIVPQWIVEDQETGYYRPARIIQITSLPRSGPFGEADFLLQNQLPKDVLDGNASMELRSAFVVIENPDLSIYIQERHKPH